MSLTQRRRRRRNVKRERRAGGQIYLSHHWKEREEYRTPFPVRSNAHLNEKGEGKKEFRGVLGGK